VQVLAEMLLRATPSEAQRKDLDFLLTLGEAFTLVVYAQLILENSEIYAIHTETLEQIFDFMVRDLSKFALQLYSKPASTPEQMDYCLKMIRRPALDSHSFQNTWRDQVFALRDEYEMKP
jgi:acyl-CoA dehydrogenase